MWNTLEQVAKHFRFPVDEFVEFGLKNKAKYHLDDHNMVGTWYVDGLIDDFRNMKKTASVDVIASELLKVARDLMASPMKYKVVRLESGKMKAYVFNTVEELVRMVGHWGSKQTGVENSSWTRKELQGAPTFNNLLGPMYDGPGSIRYEDQTSYDMLSR